MARFDTHESACCEVPREVLGVLVYRGCVVCLPIVTRHAFVLSKSLKESVKRVEDADPFRVGSFGWCRHTTVCTRLFPDATRDFRTSRKPLFTLSPIARVDEEKIR